MALTPLQRTLCKLIAANRIEGGESYIAGGVALNMIMKAGRISRDIDLFHDTKEAVQASWTSDRMLFQAKGYEVRGLRELPGFVEAQVSAGDETVLVQWAQDSAFRFFPLVQHEELGLTLHPFDLAANKVLALVGRLEVRDWIDVIHCHERIQPLGYLAWAACGKDPGFSPASILEEASRSARYSNEEVQSLSFEGSPPDANELSGRWRSALGEARDIVALLPPEHAGRCVLASQGGLYLGAASNLARAWAAGEILFHPGSIKGSLPRIVH